MGKIVNVDFKASKDLPSNIRTKFGKEFVEIRIESSEPKIILSKVRSPAKRVKEILKSDKINICL